MMKRGIFLHVLVVLLLVMQCTHEDVTGPGVPPPSLTGLQRDLNPQEVYLTNANNAFGLKLFKEIVAHPDERDKNIFISPLSVSMALGMTYNGAAGTTEEAMRNTLEYGNMTQQEINESYRSLIDLLIDLDPMVQFQIANSIWYRLGFQVKQPFIDINKTFFDAEVTGLNFTDPAAKDIINGWVDEKTNGKIPDIVDEINPEHVMFLINAIYFKGDWTSQFKTQDTRDDDFYLLDGSKKTVKMMSQKYDFGYFATQDFQAVDLPYSGKAFSMTIFLPRPEFRVDDFIAQISNETLTEWVDNFGEIEVDLSMPKFKLEYDLTMNNVLKALGMGIAFEKWEANFIKIADVRPENLYIDKVKHKTFVDVNEEGTEAAAATSVGIGITSLPQTITMIINRPFVFVIREKFSNTILFMGKIVEPELE